MPSLENPTANTLAETRAAVMAALAQQPGWAERQILGGLFCAKTFDTAAGRRDATARLDLCGGGNFWLVGEYQSEGRNVLERVIITIAPEATKEGISRAVAEFSEQVEAEVSQTYARRLQQRHRG